MISPDREQPPFFKRKRARLRVERGTEITTPPSVECLAAAVNQAEYKTPISPPSCCTKYCHYGEQIEKFVKVIFKQTGIIEKSIYTNE